VLTVPATWKTDTEGSLETSLGNIARLYLKKKKKKTEKEKQKLRQLGSNKT
jgi:hypothetical protein